MIKNYVAIQNGKVIANEGGTNLSTEMMQKKYPKAEIKAVESTRGVPIGLPVAIYGEDFIPKTPQELEEEGLDVQGKPIPTAEELAAKAEAQKLEKEELAKEAELAIAKAELGEGIWTEKRIAQKAAEIKDRELKLRIYSVADQKHRGVLTLIFGSQMQYQRDSNRYQSAQKGKFTEGENEALIKDYRKKGRALDAAIDGIEEIRSYIFDIADNDIDRAKKALENWQNYPLEGDVGDFLASI